MRLEIAQGAHSESLSIVRYPGSPNDQEATLQDAEIELTGSVTLTLYYTPMDDPVNGRLLGANPVWVIFETPDGGIVRLHHTFNVRHPGTWTWHLDAILPMLVGRAIHVAVGASDVGSDDLTFTVDWGNGGTGTTTVFNNGAGPDPFPSPEVRPMTATVALANAYTAAGTYTISVTVTDDDGGSATTTLQLTLG
ncbi:MAG: hypothetical protein E6K18_00340 [Methanobacteriota archaeon]|nr:MAG: hypothetical protein E6K18_00340 [Euryarchaeota archaeon]